MSFRPRNCAVVLLTVLCAAVQLNPATAAEVRAAVASNFKSAMTVIAREFETDTGHRLLLSFGSTGKHYAQIRNGAPFDIFLAADSERPQRLEQEGLGIAGSRFTYAIGTLVLWAPRRTTVSDADLHAGNFRFVAIANPRFAPYGTAAKEFLESIGLWDSLQKNIVRGENIAQAYQFVHSAGADLGLIAWSQLKLPHQVIRGAVWSVPQELYTPIRQQAILINNSDGALALRDYLKSDNVRALLRDYGYH